MTRFAMPAKAEVVFAALVTTRHRTVRLALVLAAAVALLATAGGTDRSDATTVVVVAASLGAVAGSRLLAPGPALEAARRAAGAWWLHPAGRLAGVATLILPLALGMAVLIAGPASGGASTARLALAAAATALALTGLTMALAPLSGATGAATVGLVLAWFGGVPPSGMAALFDAWPWVARPVVLIWNALPLGWRAARWLSRGGLADPLLAAGWIAGSIAIALWATGRWYRLDRFLAGQGAT